ncbi:monocarboxylate transporter 13-like [Ruditapes philippinarum]|uniref:monocarboxylate transporter 13-like n=1 Tax=Ruditapes philippinarum TaxID=129788 RepID=UPI00295B20F5|nr:monocarboxylate transporter 13-like [Ruditapes philippinarum]
MSEEKRRLLSSEFEHYTDSGKEEENGVDIEKEWPEPVMYNAAEASSSWREREKAFVENLSFEYNDKISDNSTEEGHNVSNNEVPFVIKLLVVFACLVSILISMGFGYSLSVLYAQLIRVFEADRSLVALNQSFFEALLAVGGALWSFPVSKIGYGYCIIIGGVVGSICVAVSSLAVNVPTIIILVGIMSGASFGIVYMGPFVVAGDIFDNQKAAVIGFVSIGSSLGQFTMSYFMELCIEAYNWNGALMVIGAICLNAVPCGMLMVIAQRYSSKDVTNKTSASAKQSLFKFSLFKEKLFWLLLLNSVILAFTALAESRFIVDLVELKGFERQVGSFFISMIGVTNLIGGLMGSVSKVMCKISSATHMGYWILVTAVSHGLVVYVDTYAGLLAASLINGLCIGNIYAHVAVAMYEIYGTEDYAPSFATWNVLKGVGNFLGGYFGGYTSETTGNYDLLFQVSIILSIFYSISFIGIVIYRKFKAKQNGYIKI